MSELDQKKAIAMRRDREAALAVIIPRLMGAVLKFGHLGYDRDGNLGTFVVAKSIDLWVRPHRHYVYLSVRYLKRLLVFNCRIYSDGSGDALNQRLSIIGWNHSIKHREWQSALFNQFDCDAGCLTSRKR